MDEYKKTYGTEKYNKLLEKIAERRGGKPMPEDRTQGGAL
jgi:hypothetical protein